MLRRSRTRRAERRGDQRRLVARLPEWGLRLLGQVLGRARGRAPALREALRVLQDLVEVVRLALAEAEELGAPEPRR